ncbi:hypothetical protein BJV78DRAFT_1168160 [Lactifluus subvellereus]|nr:hypothetical protein BJV78DRAFT_1168160 [Lactifluus subvellereus]
MDYCHTFMTLAVTNHKSERRALSFLIASELNASLCNCRSSYDPLRNRPLSAVRGVGIDARQTRKLRGRESLIPTLGISREQTQAFYGFDEDADSSSRGPRTDSASCRLSLVCSVIGQQPRGPGSPQYDGVRSGVTSSSSQAFTSALAETEARRRQGVLRTSEKAGVSEALCNHCNIP